MVMLRSLALAALLALNTSGPAPEVSPLPPFPTEIASAMGPVKILMTPELKCGNVEALGCFDGNTRQLWIRTGLPLVVEWHTLEHEKVHMIFWDAGVSITSDGGEDRLADVLATARVNEMLAKH